LLPTHILTRISPLPTHLHTTHTFTYRPFCILGRRCVYLNAIMCSGTLLACPILHYFVRGGIRISDTFSILPRYDLLSAMVWDDGFGFFYDERTWFSSVRTTGFMFT
jgi:hypothetical protein